MPIYMKFGDVEGDVTAESHKKWIALESVSWGSSRSVSTSGDAAAQTTSAVHIHPFVVTKARDSSSGKLWRECLMNTSKAVQIDWTVTSQGLDQCFQSIKLTNVKVTSFSQAAHANGNPLESISLNFTDIEATFFELAKEGVKASKPFVQSYNLSKG